MLVGGTVSERWPVRSKDEFFARDAVVHVMANAIQVEGSRARKARVLDLLPDARLEEKQFEGTLEILANGCRCCKAILVPPFVRSLDLTGGARRDAKPKRHGFVLGSRRANNASAQRAVGVCAVQPDFAAPHDTASGT